VVQTLSESAAILRHMYSAYLRLLSCVATCLSGNANTNGPIFNPLDDMKIMNKLLGEEEN